MGSIYDSGTLNALPPNVRTQVVVAGEKLDADKLQEVKKTEPGVVDEAGIARAGGQAFRRRFRRFRLSSLSSSARSPSPIVSRGAISPRSSRPNPRSLPRRSWPPTFEWAA